MGYLLAIALLGFFTGVLMRVAWLMMAGGVVTLISLARWMWPKHDHVLETEL